MKVIKTLLLILLVIVGIVLAVRMVSHLPSKQEIRAKQIIQTFMDAKGMDIEPGTDEYKIFMRRILWGEYPELTGEDSTFVDKQEEIDYILDYAWKHSGYKDMYGDYRESEEKEAVPPENK